MHIRAAEQYLRANVLAGNAVMLIGDPGIAKSERCYKNAYWFRDYVKSGNPNARVGISITNTATANPLTAVGIPWKDNKTWIDLAGKEATHTVTDHAVPSWFMATCLDTGEVLPAFMFDYVYLVLEEWGQGSPDAKRAFAEILLNGGTGIYYLPKGSARIALSNISASDGVTKEFGFIDNRVGKGPVVGDVVIWDEDWASHPYQWQGKTWQVSPEMRRFALTKPTEFLEPKPKDGKQWCTPRSGAALDRYIQMVTQLNNGKIPFDDENFIQGCQGHTGVAHVNSYLADLKAATLLPTYEAVVTNPSGTPVPSKIDEQMLMVFMLAARATREDLPKVMTYIDKRDANGNGIARDMNVAFIKTLLRRGDYTLLNEPSLEAWTSKHSYLMGIISSIAN
jgi:hypothetical protein